MPCQRCHEMMVRDHFLDVQDGRGYLWMSVWRCINCEERVEPVTCRVCVHYSDQEELVWCDTVHEAITYIVAENIGRGLHPFTGLQKIIKITKGTNDDHLLSYE